MSAQDLIVLRGRAASDVVLHRSDDLEAKVFGRFRMAVPRSRRRDDGEWEEIDPHWYTVKVWGHLAEHVNLSIRRGNPVIVVGRPVAQAWINRLGEAQADMAVHAVSVGHDLVFGVTSFSRLRRHTPEIEEEGEARLTRVPLRKKKMSPEQMHLEAQMRSLLARKTKLNWRTRSRRLRKRQRDATDSLPA